VSSCWGVRHTVVPFDVCYGCQYGVAAASGVPQSDGCVAMVGYGQRVLRDILSESFYWKVHLFVAWCLLFWWGLGREFQICLFVAVVCNLFVQILYGQTTSEWGFARGRTRDTASSDFMLVMRCWARLRRGHYLYGLYAFALEVYISGCGRECCVEVGVN